MIWPKILVTGAGGFIGGRIAQTLHAAGARDLRAGVSRPPGATANGQALDTVVCDMFRDETLDAALTGAEVVIHCARSQDEAASVLGTRRVLERAKAAGVRRFIHLSSVAVYGDAEGQIVETTPPHGRLDAYARGKLASEQDCRRMADAAMSVAVLRPALVYGPGSQLWTVPYIARLLSGRWKRLGAGGEGRANLIYVDDLAAFAGFLAARDIEAFSVFNVDGPEVPTWNDYLDRFSDALDVPRPTGLQTTSLAGAALRRPFQVAGKRLLSQRSRLVAASGPFGLLTARRLDEVESSLRLAPSHQELKLYRLKAVYGMDEAARIGFRPQTPLERGLDLSVAWATQAGLIPQRTARDSA